MKYVIIIGGAVNIFRPFAKQLLNAKRVVTVVGRTAEKLKPLFDQGC